MEPEPTQEEIIEYVSWVVTIVTVQSSIRLVGYTAYSAHWFETLEEEVSMIWGERWILGKFLFLTTRYSVILKIIFELFGSFPSELPLSLKTCDIISIVTSVLAIIQSYSAIASILLCMYALLGAKRKWILLLLSPYLGFLTVTVVGNILYLLSSDGVADPYLPETYKCNFLSGDPRWFTMAGYNVLVRDIGMAVVSGITFYVRYRGQKNSLIRVIRRDGALLYVTACLLAVVTAILYSPNFPVVDHYQVVVLIRGTMYSILANHLLLNMKKMAHANYIGQDVGTNFDRYTIGELLFAQAPLTRRGSMSLMEGDDYAMETVAGRPS